MENPKQLYNHPDWPPSISIPEENVVERTGEYDPSEGARAEVREKFNRGKGEDE